MIRSIGVAPAFIATGHVSIYNEATHTARIKFDDMDGLVSHPYQVCVARSKYNQSANHLDVDEHVLCICMGNGLETGFVIGTLYDQKNPPPTQNKEQTVFRFKDGAFFMHDRELHITQFVDSFGSFVQFEDGDIVFQSAGKIRLNPGNDSPVKIAQHINSLFD